MPLYDASSLPEELFSADAVRAIDRYVIDEQGVDGFELMQLAAASAFRQLIKRWPRARHLLVLCGAGNNGGDGYLIAANARRHDLNVHCVAVAPTDKLKGDAKKAWLKARQDGVEVHAYGESEGDFGATAIPFDDCDVIVDAMLGTGVTGSPRDPFAAIIERCNRSPVPVLAVDVPSGLDATNGVAAEPAIRAELTVSFIAMKAGLMTGAGPECCGQIAFEALGTEQWVPLSGQSPIARRVSWQNLMTTVPRRPMHAHKGRFGHVLIVAGDRGFGGAGILAAEAAARTGAGLITLATRPEYVGPALARCPSVMAHGVTHGSELTGLMENASVIVCGPGLGRGAWGQQMLQQVVASGKPRVLDADALNLLSTRVPVPADNHILTPHPGEAARLLGCSVREIEADRLKSAQQMQQMFGGVVLLKGAGTVVAGGKGLPVIVGGGNPGMATGGTGDVLSGIIGSLYGQFEDAAMATEMGVALHLAAANEASLTRGFMGLLPGDVIDAVPCLLKAAEHLPDASGLDSAEQAG